MISAAVAAAYDTHAPARTTTLGSAGDGQGEGAAASRKTPARLSRGKSVRTEAHSEN